MSDHRAQRFLSRCLCVAATVVACASFVAPPRAFADTTFLVNGRGWGHGIGLSQYGAKGFADQGQTYGWILAHYFQQTDLGTRSNLTVKVDIDASKSARTSWWISAASSSATLTVTALTDPAKTYSISPGASAWITFDSQGAVLRKDHYDSATKKHSASTVLRSFGGSAIAGVGAQSASMVRVLSPSGPFAESSIAWRGLVRFVPSSSTAGHAIDYVGMEDYLRGVVPRESPSSWAMEALKAQAVAARSYAFDAAASGSVLYCTTMSQVYNGSADGSSRHEADRTDAAVAATVNRVVTYGSSVVKTYFSSSSGGRTANSKDVWFTDSADDLSPVYYTTVTDADTGSPNYRWPTTSISGTALAEKVRTHYVSDSFAAPATVTGVSTQAGTSGFIRYVTLRWSNGKTSTLKGPELQHALGLKSSAFTVVAKDPPPVGTRFEQTDPRLVWSGSWTLVKGTALSGGDYRYASRAGAQTTVCFKGTTVSWIGTTAKSFGKADVYLDGTRVVTVDLYASTTHYKQIIWTKAGLSADATHTLVVRVLGSHRSTATGSNVGIDAVDLVGTLVTVPKPPTWSRIEEDAAAISYSQGWTRYFQPLLSAGAYRQASYSSSVATLTFTGSRVKWIGSRGVRFGKATVSLDGARPVTVDLYAASAGYRLALWDSGVIPAGVHKLRIAALYQKAPRSLGYRVGIDAFDVLAP